jgi:glycosyltransferase involved in cell wall biosynthesis
MASADGPLTVAWLGTFLPRRCGLATYASHLMGAVQHMRPDWKVIRVAMSSNSATDDEVPPDAICVPEMERAAYSVALGHVQALNADILCVQHEFGIFGGPAGSYLAPLLGEASVPSITTLHTVLRWPSPIQRHVLQTLCGHSSRVVTLSSTASRLLKDVYDIPTEKIELFPHGVSVPKSRNSVRAKQRLDLGDRPVLLTSGFLSRDKGIELVLHALPKIVRHFPDVLYIVAGVTHPKVRAAAGEEYRTYLHTLVDTCNLKQNVRFVDRFLTDIEIDELHEASDVYVSATRSEEQIASGSLSRAIGHGKAIVATASPYAVELLHAGRGLVVPHGRSDALSSAILRILQDEGLRARVSCGASDLATQMSWPMVASRYVELIESEHRDRTNRSPNGVSATMTRNRRERPRVALDHLLRMTDDTGLLQHAIGTLPNRSEGYCSDDNARALLLTSRLSHETWSSEVPVQVVRDLSTTYLSFIWHAFSPETGRIRNFMTFDRRWLETQGSEECHGRTLWALAALLTQRRRSELHDAAATLFGLLLPAVDSFQSSRALSYCIIAMRSASTGLRPTTERSAYADKWTGKLLATFASNATENWPWLEDRLTYFNAVIPHALLTNRSSETEDISIQTGLNVLDWLYRIQSSADGHFRPIGNRGWFPRGGPCAQYDQQPIEAKAMVDACLAAFKVTRESRWLNRANTTFDWFLGANDAGIPIADPLRGACHDGLHSDGINFNQGAESTLSYLLALSALKHMESLETH